MSYQNWRGGVFTANVNGTNFYRYRDDKVCNRVARGLADIGFLGSDFYVEQANRPDTLACNFDDLRIPIGQFVLASSVEEVEKYRDILETDSATQVYRVATKYPVNLTVFSEERGFPLWPLESSSVEADLKLGLAELIFDLRVTGETLAANGLGIVAMGQWSTLGLIYKKSGIWRDGDNRFVYNEDKQ